MAQNKQRGRNQRRRQSTNVNRAMDSTGPDVKIRGTALQIYDKYQNLARDAASAGDRVRAESLLQHAEHYFRVMRAMQPKETPQNDPADEPQPSVSKDDDDSGTDERKDDRKKSSQSERKDKSDPKADKQPAEADDSDSETSSEDSESEKPVRRRRRPSRKTASEDTGNDNADKASSDDKVAEVAAE